MLNASQFRRSTLISKPYCSVRSTSDQSTNSGVATAVLWDTDISDDWGMHDTVSNTSRIVVPIGGTYIVLGGVAWEASTMGVERSIYLLLSDSGATPVTNLARELRSNSGFSASFSYIMSIASEVRADAGDFFELYAAHDGGSALNVLTNNRNTYLAVHWVGAQSRSV